MNVVKESAKTIDGAKDLVLKKLNAKEEDCILDVKESENGLLKIKMYECTGFLKGDLLTSVLEFIENILKAMGLDFNTEVLKNENGIIIKIYSSNNSLLIGKNGQNLESLNILVRQYIKKYSSAGFKINVDVENYQDKQIEKLEALAKKLAHEVLKTKIAIEMDNMNSYERRIVHNVLSTFNDLSTESVGVEPNRHIVIKYAK